MLRALLLSSVFLLYGTVGKELINIENDTSDLLCRVCNSRGDNCFSLDAGTVKKGVEMGGAHDGKLVVLCSSDKPSESGVEHNIRELHQGVMDLNIWKEGVGDEVLLISTFLDGPEKGKNLFVHVQDEYHQGLQYGSGENVDHQADYEGKSRADALLSVVHTKMQG